MSPDTAAQVPGRCNHPSPTPTLTYTHTHTNGFKGSWEKVVEGQETLTTRLILSIGEPFRTKPRYDPNGF